MKMAFLISCPRSLARWPQWEEEPKIGPRGIQSEDRTHSKQFDITTRPRNIVKIYFPP